MLDRLVSFSLTQRVFIMGVALLLVIAGLYASARLPIDAFPEIAPTQVKIILKAPGMTPEEVEARVVRPLEMELLGIPDQTIMRAKAKYAIADITIDFKEGTDIYWARQLVGERLIEAREQIPEGYGDPEMGPISSGLGEIRSRGQRVDPLQSIPVKRQLGAVRPVAVQRPEITRTVFGKSGQRLPGGGPLHGQSRLCSGRVQQWCADQQQGEGGSMDGLDPGADLLESVLQGRHTCLRVSSIAGA